MGEGSPDRADATIWGLSELFPRVASSSASDPSRQTPGKVGTWGTYKGKRRQISYLPEGHASFWARQRDRTNRRPPNPQR